MATVTFSIDTQATGVQTLAYTLTEDEIQAVFAAMLGKAAKITDEGVERDRTLGECLRDEVNALMTRLAKQAGEYQVEKAKEDAAKAVTPITVTPELVNA